MGKVGALIAEGGAGKTFCLVQLALAVATERSWLDTFNVSTPGRVLLVVGEEDHEEAKRRVFNVARATNSEPPDEDQLLVLPLAGVPSEMLHRDIGGNIQEAPFLTWTRSFLATRDQWSLIILDPLSRFSGPGAERDNHEATRFVQALESLAKQTGATVLVAHHTSQSSRSRDAKASATAGRGVTGITDGIRWVSQLTPDDLEELTEEQRASIGSMVRLDFVKSNYSKLGERLLLQRNDEGALLPLDAINASQIKQARDREQTRIKFTAKRLQDDEAAIINILSKAPTGISSSNLRTAMRVALGNCSNQRVSDSLLRLGDRVATIVGARNVQMHILTEYMASMPAPASVSPASLPPAAEAG